ncbi:MULTISPECIES: hypothetical protein [Clostridium]|uniref:Uncharacterized protein n=1 Tax=Clostridium senegalense TaxID=1465809 RepID=A0A6M0GZ12_9CLOT|nr:MULTISPECIES: hypothetical protein [Clostridium]NEU03816.1 hypothetical protein [Clostridium senegalense]
MRYIGPFLRINILDNENIKSQLFHLSKHSIFNIVFSSGCGVISPNLRSKNKILPTTDDIINDANSPLLSLYRKANGKLLTTDSQLKWNEKKFKKEINIAANALMTLSILELADYYNEFLDIDENKYALKNQYLDLASEQLEFYALYCRNNEGVFVDKVDTTEAIAGQYNLYDKNTKFKFSTQALFMSAYYKFSTYDKFNYNNQYKNFSLDILNMFLDFKEEVYNIPQDELIKVCFAFITFYKYSHIDEAKYLLLDFADLMLENLKYIPPTALKDNLDTTALLYINCMFIYKETKIKKFKQASEKAYSVLESLYDSNKGLFLKDIEEKENKIYCDEIILYLYAMMLHNDMKKSDGEESDNSKVNNVYRNQVIGWDLVLSWPDCPSLDDIERYKNFSSNSEDLLQEEYFRMSSLQSAETNGLAPIFSKYVTYNTRKNSLKPNKLTFDAYKNMLIFYVILFSKRVERS